MKKINNSVKLLDMKKIGFILNVLLSLVYCYYITNIIESLLVGIIVSLFLLAIFSWMHSDICDTPTKSTEIYESWKRFLHDDRKAISIRCASIVVMVYVYVSTAFCFFYYFCIEDARTWVIGLITFSCACSYFVIEGYGHADALKESKKIYEELRKSLLKNQYVNLIKHTGKSFNPDTSLIGEIVQTDEEHWELISFIKDEIFVKYDIYDEPMANFIRKFNDTSLNTENVNGIFAEGVETVRSFCSKHKTLGELAIWIKIEDKANKTSYEAPYC